MPTPPNERLPESDKMSLPEYLKKLEEAGIIYYNEDGEVCTTPGVIPVDTIQKEIEQGIRNLD